MLKVIIFDLDETLMHLLVDWDKAKEEIIDYAKKRKLNFDSELHIIPLSMQISINEEIKREVDTIWRKFEKETIENKRIKLYPEANKFVKELHSKGYILAIASNNCHASIEEALRFANLREYFSYIIGRDDVRNTKPAPDMLFKILDHFKVKSDEVLFFGDSENDFKAAKAAGIRVVIIQPGKPFPELKF